MGFRPQVALGERAAGLDVVSAASFNDAFLHELQHQLSALLDVRGHVPQMFGTVGQE